MKFVKKFVEVNIVHSAAAVEVLDLSFLPYPALSPHINSYNGHSFSAANQIQKRKGAGIRAPLSAKRSQRKVITRAEWSQHEDSCSVVDIVRNSHKKQIARRKAVVKHTYSEGKCTTQKIALVSSQNNWVKTRACEREHDDGSELDSENSTVAKKRKFDELQRLASLQEFSASSPFLIPSPAANFRIKPTHFRPGVKNSLKVGLRRGSFVRSGSMVSIPSLEATVLIFEIILVHDSFENCMILQECLTSPEGLEYRTKLKSALGQAFNANELEVLYNLVRCRKRIQKLRQMRGRTIDVVTEDEGLSYLDHHRGMPFFRHRFTFNLRSRLVSYVSVACRLCCEAR